jgi:hypothetical protein
MTAKAFLLYYYDSHPAENDFLSCEIELRQNEPNKRRR